MSAAQLRFAATAATAAIATATGSSWRASEGGGCVESVAEMSAWSDGNCSVGRQVSSRYAARPVLSLPAAATWRLPRVKRRKSLRLTSPLLLRSAILTCEREGGHHHEEGVTPP